MIMPRRNCNTCSHLETRHWVTVASGLSQSNWVPRLDFAIFMVKDQKSYIVLIARINTSPRLLEALGVTLRLFIEDPEAAIAAMTLMK